MSERRRFLKGLTSLPPATVLANPRLAAAVSAGLQEVETKLADGRTIKAALAQPQGQARGSILLVHEWGGGSSISVNACERCGFPIGWRTLVRILVWGNPQGGRRHVYRTRRGACEYGYVLGNNETKIILRTSRTSRAD